MIGPGSACARHATLWYPLDNLNPYLTVVSPLVVNSHQRPPPISAIGAFNPGKINPRYCVCAVHGVKPLVGSDSEVILEFVGILIVLTRSLTADAGHCSSSCFHGAQVCTCNENPLHSYHDIASAQKVVDSTFSSRSSA